MAFEKNLFLTAKKVALPKQQLSVECNVMTGQEVKKVLSAGVQADVIGQEVLDGMLSYSGQMNVSLIFLNGEGELCTVTSKCPFSSKFESSSLQKGQCAFIMVEIAETNCEVSGSESVRIDVSAVQSGFVVSNQENEMLSCYDEDVCYQNEEVEVIKFAGCQRDSAMFESEVNLRGDLKKVLSVESQALVKNVESGTGYICISGEIVSRVLYVNQNDKVESGWINDSFKQEIEFESISRDDLVEGYASVRAGTTECEVASEENVGKFTIKTSVDFLAVAYQKQNLTIVKDLFGLNEEINLSYQSYEMTTTCPVEVLEGKIDGSLTLDEDKPRVDKLLFSGANKVSLTNHYIQDGQLYVEGITQTTVVYLNDETSQIYSVVVDVPFALSDKVCCPSDELVMLNAVVCDGDVVVKKGRELLFDAKIKVSVSCGQKLVGGVIASAQKGESYPQRNYAMEVVFAKKGMSLWEVAKKVKSPEEKIVAQNPDIVFPTEENTPIVLYYQRVQ